MRTPEAPRDARIDELRQRLRTLGYLDAGIDRYVLGATRGTPHPLAIAARAGLRIGLLAGMLVGPAAAIGVAARMPGLITSARDGFMVALYIGALFGGGVAVAAFAASAGVALLVTRARARRALALGAGLLIAAASLAYLTLWWGRATIETGGGFWGTAWTAAALAVAAGVSLLLGHAVTVSALAVSVARAGRGGLEHGVPGASRRTLGAAGLLALGVAAALYTITARAVGPAVSASPLTVVSTGLRLRLLAIDGVDPQIASRLAARGEIPALAAALAIGPEAGSSDDRGEAASFPVARARVDMDDTADPARAWTTIATGQPAAVHAVEGLETRRLAGVRGTIATREPSALGRAIGAATDLLRLTRPSLASGSGRRAKAFWEVAAAAGLRTAVVNWWATWPAGAGPGVVVSDRAALRLEHGGELDAEIAPPDLYDDLRSRWPALRASAEQAARAIAAAADAQPLLRRAAELDALQMGLTRAVSSPDLDLVVTYLPGLDVVQHGLLSSPDGTAPSPSSLAARLVSIEAYYVFLERLLDGSLTAAPGEMLVIVTSPGRVEAGTPGLLTVRAPAANARARDASGRALDVAPTILHALGLPLSRELAGRTLVELFAADFARRHPIRQVDTYGSPHGEPPASRGRPLDQEMIDRLRSLGYVR